MYSTFIIDNIPKFIISNIYQVWQAQVYRWLRQCARACRTRGCTWAGSRWTWSAPSTRTSSPGSLPVKWSRFWSVSFNIFIHILHTWRKIYYNGAGNQKMTLGVIRQHFPFDAGLLFTSFFAALQRFGPLTMATSCQLQTFSSYDVHAELFYVLCFAHILILYLTRR